MRITHTLSFFTEAGAASFVSELKERSDFASLHFQQTGTDIRVSDRTYFLIQDSIQNWVASQR